VLSMVRNMNYVCSLGRPYMRHTVCPTRYRTRNFFNYSNTNEDIATKFEQEYVRCVRNEEECVCSVCVCSAPKCRDTEQFKLNAGFGSEWDTLYEGPFAHRTPCPCRSFTHATPRPCPAPTVSCPP